MRSHGARRSRGSSRPGSISTRTAPGARRGAGLLAQRLDALQRVGVQAPSLAWASAGAGAAAPPGQRQRAPADASAHARKGAGGRCHHGLHSRPPGRAAAGRNDRPSVPLFALMFGRGAAHNATACNTRRTGAAMINRLTDSAGLPEPGAGAALRAPAADRQQHRQRRHAGLRGPRHGFRRRRCARPPAGAGRHAGAAWRCARSLATSPRPARAPRPSLRYAAPSQTNLDGNSGGHGPRARHLRRQRGEVRGHAALHQRQRAHHARRDEGPQQG